MLSNLNNLSPGFIHLHEKDSNSISLLKELWKEAKAGSVEHFQEIHSYLYPELFNYSLFIFNNPRKANELLSDVFSEIWRKRKRKVSGKYLRAIFYKNLRTAIFRHIQDNSLHYAENYISGYPFHDFNDSVNFIGDTLNSYQHLSLQSKEILYLNCHCKLSEEEISKILSLSANSLRIKLSCAITALNKPVMHQYETVL